MCLVTSGPWSLRPWSVAPYPCQRCRRSCRHNPKLSANGTVRQVIDRRVIQPGRIRPQVRRQIHAQEPIRPHRHRRRSRCHLLVRCRSKRRPADQHRSCARLPIGQEHRPLYRCRRHRLPRHRQAAAHSQQHRDHNPQPNLGEPNLHRKRPSHPDSH